MILKALYDYYHRCDDMPQLSRELKEIDFLIVLSKEGKFIRLEDCRIDSKHSRPYMVCKSVSRTSAPEANCLYDKLEYVACYPKTGNSEKCFRKFKEKTNSLHQLLPHDKEIAAVAQFYNQDVDDIIGMLQHDSLWEEIETSLQKKSAKKGFIFSFRIDGSTKIVAEKDELLVALSNDECAEKDDICLITGNKTHAVEITTATMIPGSKTPSKLVAFQVNSGYDSYGKSKGGNAPISAEAEFAYTTALNRLIDKKSHNKFTMGNRTFVFWASSLSEAAKRAEEGFSSILLFPDEKKDDPNAGIQQVRRIFEAIYRGKLATKLNDRFFILGLAPNAARIAVVYWQDSPLRDFAQKILRHFNDMEIAYSRKEKKPYMGLWHMLSAVTISGEASKVSPNLPEAVAKSIFEGTPYPFTLYSACLRRIMAEQKLTITRVAILKAYLIRKQYLNSNITIMLDKENTNQGYLLGRLFAVLVKIQEDANGIDTMRERYMNAASTTPATVFATVMNLSVHHAEKLSEGSKIYYEKLKQEIISKLPAGYVPAHLDLQEQGCFFIGYYHQRQDFFTSKDNNNQQNNKN